MNVLVTGSRGFVGGALGRAAAREGATVLGVSRSSQPADHWPGEHAQADVAQADLSPLIRDFEPDLIVHGAGTASVASSLSQPLDDLRAALITWANVLDSVRRSGTNPTVIFPSSAAVYGNPASIPVGEDAPIAPISPYGFHKAACELIGREYAECFGLGVLIVRLFSVFGAGQHRLFMWEIYNQARGAKPEIEIDGTGFESRDYLHIDDVCNTMLELGRKTESGCVTVNVASGTESVVMRIAEEIRDLVAPKKKIRCAGHARPGDPLRWCADVSRLRDLLPGWEPRELSCTLESTIREWRDVHG